MKRRSYPSDLTEDEWLLLEPLLPPPQRIGHPREVNLKEILNAIFYWADNGIKWRAMPHDFPPWQTVYGYFRSWVRTGIWSAINHSLVQRERRVQGRSADPSLIMIDSQSVKIAHQGGSERGFDGGKQVKGRKRHIAVDCLGLVHNCFVHAANRADVKTAPTVLVPVLEESARIEKILASPMLSRFSSSIPGSRLQLYSRNNWASGQKLRSGALALGRRENFCACLTTRGVLGETTRSCQNTMKG